MANREEWRRVVRVLTRRSLTSMVAGRVLRTSVLFVIALTSAQARTVTTDESSLLQDAGRAMTAGNFVRAEEDLKKILYSSPDNYQASDLLGILRAQQHRESDAEKIFQKVVDKHPRFAGAHIHLGLLYIQMGENERAIPELQNGLHLAPDRTDAANALVGIWREQARAAMSGGETEKALSVLLQARRLSPEDPEVQFEFGMVALKMNLLPDAIGAFQKTLKIRPDDANAIYGLGRAFMQHAQFEEARRQFARYLALRPKDASGHYALGMAYTSLERTQEAKAEFEKSILLAPVQTESYFRLGVLDLDSRDLASAEKNFRHVLERDPKHAGSLAALGRVEYDEKKFQESADLLERAIASDNSLREAHYYLGLTYARLGKKQDSEQQFQIATQLEHQQLEEQKTDFKVLDAGSGTASSPAN